MPRCAKKKKTKGKPTSPSCNYKTVTFAMLSALLETAF